MAATAFIRLRPAKVPDTLKNYANGDTWKNIRVYYNGDTVAKTIPLEGTWTIACNGEVISLNSGEKTQNQTVTIPAHSAMILYQE